MSRCEFVNEGKDILSVSETCRLLEVPRSSYYAHCRRRPSKRARADEVLAVHVRAIHTRSRQRYGSPRVMRALRKRG